MSSQPFSGIPSKVPLGVWISLRLGWQGAFLVTGLLGFLWMLAFQIYWRFHPHLRARDRGKEAGAGRAPAWRSLLAYHQTWVVFVCRFLADPIWYFYIFWIPEFLARERGLGLVGIGAVAWIPFLVSDISNFTTGLLAKRLEGADWSVNRTRKFLMIL